MIAYIGSAKDIYGVRESNMFIREEWPYPDKGILINNHICIELCVFIYIIYTVYGY